MLVISDTSVRACVLSILEIVLEFIPNMWNYNRIQEARILRIQRPKSTFKEVDYQNSCNQRKISNALNTLFLKITSTCHSSQNFLKTNWLEVTEPRYNPLFEYRFGHLIIIQVKVWIPCQLWVP